MIGARCADLIAEAVTAMEFRASAEDILRMCLTHTQHLQKLIKEAALAATDTESITRVIKISYYIKNQIQLSLILFVFILKLWFYNFF